MWLPPARSKGLSYQKSTLIKSKMGQKISSELLVCYNCFELKTAREDPLEFCVKLDNEEIENFQTTASTNIGTLNTYIHSAINENFSFNQCDRSSSYEFPYQETPQLRCRSLSTYPVFKNKKIPNHLTQKTETYSQKGLSSTLRTELFSKDLKMSSIPKENPDSSFTAFSKYDSSYSSLIISNTNSRNASPSKDRGNFN